ncbi:hypothetical protein THRCLA_22525 [Thraustotheca clavata]|uniref:Protein kinase domain-containing protein n=1 Tax=Thraustotheca clavata TaxID=74557 RepID=A0A1V9YY91_9STRA|nr:hypothetical protein THRCLA_22525 [Thraustotheca clavata]
MKHSVPNVAELLDTDIANHCAVLKPIGVACKPRNVRELLVALRDILEALVAMHAINIIHRDFRWDNILKQTTQEKWFLIGFEDGAISPAKKAIHLNTTLHTPEVITIHIVKVDIWSVGYLLRTCEIEGLSTELNKIKLDCLQHEPSTRPTAESLLKSINSFFKE